MVAVDSKAGEGFEEDKKVVLDTVTRFNIKARYDDYKHNFYKLCTDEFDKSLPIVNQIIKYGEKIEIEMKNRRGWFKSIIYFD
ncbi:MAG: hypothetical protein U5L09_01545 [Bacteroidales bacterium]|nr:hypothetical protein [Bacteroidales bacterium]